jgi:serine phosphatase RsbU (regulator of sigma subunit)
MRLPFQKTVELVSYRQPVTTTAPELRTSEVAAHYLAPRIGGDFYDFVSADHGRLVFVLFDIAGQRDRALDVAAAVQDGLRELVPAMFRDVDLNEADAVTELVLQLNNIILRVSNGICCAPGFVGCYNESVGIISYINAGHIAALVWDGAAITSLEASGLPLGLFSHATHEAGICALPDQGALLLASKGLLEVRIGNDEYGIERLKQSFGQFRSSNAQDVCAGVLKDVKNFVTQQKRRRFLGITGHNGNDALKGNDITAVALVRAAARAGAAAR